MSHQQSRYPDDLASTPLEAAANPNGGRRMREVLEAQRRQREQAEVADGTEQRPAVEGKPIAEEVLDEEPPGDPHSDLPEPGGAEARDAETELRMWEAVEAGRRQRQQAELDDG